MQKHVTFMLIKLVRISQRSNIEMFFDIFVNVKLCNWKLYWHHNDVSVEANLNTLAIFAHYTTRMAAC